MLEDPGLDTGELTEALRTSWGIEASSFTFVPGYDMRAASYAVALNDAHVFFKVHFGPVALAPLEVPLALVDAGVPNVLASIRTLTSGHWHELGGGRAAVLYPFVAGQNAMIVGMTADQWRTFGTTLRAVHDSHVAEQFVDRLPAEAFTLVSTGVVRDVLELARRPAWRSRAARRLASLLRAKTSQIEAMIERAEALGSRLGGRSFANVLCHADIHAANILVADDGRILLVDWDGPMLAPRERDLLFVVGSRIARAVEAREEAWFFEGYGEVEVNAEAIVYYRYERILEDIGEFGASVLGDGDLPESSRESQVALAESFFEPAGIIATAEQTRRLRSSTAATMKSDVTGAIARSARRPT